MANTGDSFVVALGKTHLGWGTHRFTDSRPLIYGEGYIPIPSKYAKEYNVFNSNGTKGDDVVGKNIFFCRSADGLFSGVLKAQGGDKRGSIFAKQFAEEGNLKGLGNWYSKVNMQEGDFVKVIWITPNEIVIEKV